MKNKVEEIELMTQQKNDEIMRKVEEEAKKKAEKSAKLNPSVSFCYRSLCRKIYNGPMRISIE
jgi:hypothetical protein